jgi:uncharacterized protein
MSNNPRPLALVTGASSGIGVCYAHALAKRGYDLILVARRADRLQEVAKDLATLGAQAETLVADLSKDEDCNLVVQACQNRPLELLINNAAVAHYQEFASMPAERADEVVRVNTLALVNLSNAAIKGMVQRGKGAIVNVASLLAFSGAAQAPGLPQRAVYAATKAFVVAFSQVLSAELEGTGVMVQVVCPGMVVSEFHSRQGIDMTGRPRLPAEDVVKASLIDLDRNVSVCIPTLEDTAAFNAIAGAQGNLLGQALRPALATRYDS